MQNSPQLIDAPETVSVRLVGMNGEGFAVFDYQDWLCMCPAACVLAIHQQRRDLTNGQPFNILSVIRI